MAGPGGYKTPLQSYSTRQTTPDLVSARKHGSSLETIFPRHTQLTATHNFLTPPVVAGTLAPEPVPYHKEGKVITEIEGLISVLLEKAVARVTITNQYTKTPVDINWFRGNLQLHWTRHVPDFNMNINPPRHFRISIDDKVLMDQLVEALGLALEGNIQDDRVQTATMATVLGYGPGFEMAELAERLLIVAIGRGHQHAARNLFKGIQQGVAEYKVIQLLTGIHIESEIEVRPGIRLVPLPSSTAELPPIFGYMGRIQTKDLLNKTVIVTDLTVSPVYTSPDSFVLPEEVFKHQQQCTDLPDFDIQTFCDALSLISNGAIEWVSDWTFIKPDEVFVVHGENLGSARIQISALRERTNIQIDTEQIEGAISLYTSMKSLKDREADKLQIPITRWIKSKTRQPLVDTFIDLGIALESLYLDPGTGEQQSFRLRLRAALFLRETVNEREAVIKDIREIYGLRSKAVHEGAVNDSEATHSLKEKAEELCRESIINTVSYSQVNGEFPQWSRLELGDAMED